MIFFYCLPAGLLIPLLPIAVAFFFHRGDQKSDRNVCRPWNMYLYLGILPAVGSWIIWGIGLTDKGMQEPAPYLGAIFLSGSCSFFSRFSPAGLFMIRKPSRVRMRLAGEKSFGGRS